MKIILLFGFCILVLCCFSQERRLVPVRGKILSPDSIAVSEAYIINQKELLISISSNDGSFNIWADPNDSLVITHISFIKTTVRASEVLANPNIFLEPNTIMLKQVVVGNDKNTPEKYLEKNVAAIKSADIRIYKRMDPEMSKISSFVTENNSVLRTQASSLSLASFSPSKVISAVLPHKKKAQKQKGFNFYKNEKQKLRAEKRKAKE
jgi:hypothetical protein